jgi:hypothetical protein
MCQCWKIFYAPKNSQWRGKKIEREDLNNKNGKMKILDGLYFVGVKGGGVLNIWGVRILFSKYHYQIQA